MLQYIIPSLKLNIKTIMSLVRRVSGDFRHLCKPAMVYLAVSAVALIAIAYQNMGLNNMYCMGDFSCYVPSTAAVIFSEGLYILFWTWILNLMCRTGYASISWLLVVFPLVLFFVLIGLMMLASIKMTQQGRVKKLLPIERPVLTDQRKFPVYQPMFPPGPPMREGLRTTGMPTDLPTDYGLAGTRKDLEYDE